MRASRRDKPIASVKCIPFSDDNTWKPWKMLPFLFILCFSGFYYTKPIETDYYVQNVSDFGHYSLLPISE